jgi:hypothetical protein
MFGCMAYEFLTFGRRPYDELDGPQVVVRLGTGRLKLAKYLKSDDRKPFIEAGAGAVLDVFERCLEMDTADRPSMETISKDLDAVWQSLSGELRAQLRGPGTPSGVSRRPSGADLNRRPSIESEYGTMPSSKTSEVTSPQTDYGGIDLAHSPEYGGIVTSGDTIPLSPMSDYGGIGVFDAVSKETESSDSVSSDGEAYGSF